METTNGNLASARARAGLESTRLEVCRVCLDLRGPLSGAANALVQQCRCAPKEKRWRGFDFNVAFELCYLCAAEVIPSGSRWSSFYCEGCRDRAEHALPRGRHALMSESSAELAGEGSRIDRIRAWRQRRVRELLHGAAGSAVPLTRYLAHARGQTAPNLGDLLESRPGARVATSSSRRARW